MGEVNDEIVHEHLKNLIEGSPMSWTYAILWRCYCSPKLTLRFHEGYYRGSGKAKEVQILGSCVSVTEEVTDAESEWFFKISMGQTFAFHEDLLGRAFLGSDPVWITAADTDASMWKRATWGHQFGIQTFLCIPLRTGSVLELASTQIIPCNLETIEDMADFIRPIGTPRHLSQQFRKDKRLHERANIETHNRESDNLSRQSRDKEKINDSKCSWSLLSDSSDRGTERTFSYSHDYSGPS